MIVCKSYNGPVYQVEKDKFLSEYKDGPGYGPSAKCCTNNAGSLLDAVEPNIRSDIACIELVNSPLVDADVNTVGLTLISLNLLQLAANVHTATIINIFFMFIFFYIDYKPILIYKIPEKSD